MHAMSLYAFDPHDSSPMSRALHGSYLSATIPERWRRAF